MISDLHRRFRSFAGRDGRASFAPGRVNLIGEHTDYTGGFVLPASLTLGVGVVAASRDDTIVRVRSEDRDEVTTFSLDVHPSQAHGDWSDYVAGVAWSLQEAGLTLRGADLVVSSDVPMGAGLSSSAALEVSVAYALLDVARQEMPRLALAQACQRAESEFVGTRSGIMDQFIATHGQADHALFLDCSSHQWQAVPLPTTTRWLVANTMVRHELANSEYNLRRAECEESVSVASQLLPHRNRLADLDPAESERLAGELPSHLVPRLRHLVSENQRVHDAVEAIRFNEMATLGKLLNASHASLRTDFEVSSPELDLMVDLSLELPGVLGARMMGAGFGGCTLTLVEAEHAESTMLRLQSEYEKTMGTKPAVFLCEFGDAAGPCRE